MNDKDRLCHALDVLLKEPVGSRPLTFDERVDLGVRSLLQAIEHGGFREAVAALMMSVANETRAAMERDRAEGGAE